MSKVWKKLPSSSENSINDDETIRENGDNVEKDEDTMDERLENCDNEADNIDASSQDPNLAWEKIRRRQPFLPVVHITSSSTNDHPRREAFTRFVVISDTHGKHRQLYLPPGDVLIHAGDFSKTGELGTIEDLSSFFGELRNNTNDNISSQIKYQEIICIAGNHDMSLDTDYYINDQNWYKGTLPNPKRNPKRFQQRQEDATSARRAISQNCRYLENTSYTINVATDNGDLGDPGNGASNDNGNGDNGIVVFGSPHSPTFYHWGFNAERGDDINKIWDRIPNYTDILITHGPPLGRGDMTTTNGRAGCFDLLKQIQNRIQPRVSISGHIHEGYGVSFDGHTLYINGSTCNLNYEVHENLPIVFDLPHDKSLPGRLVKPKCEIQTIDELINYCNDINLTELADSLKTCVYDLSDSDSSNNSGSIKIPLGDDLLDLDTGINEIVEALSRCSANLDGVTVTNLHRQLIRQFRPKLYADSFHCRHPQDT